MARFFTTSQTWNCWSRIKFVQFSGRLSSLLISLTRSCSETTGTTATILKSGARHQNGGVHDCCLRERRSCNFAADHPGRRHKTSSDLQRAPDSYRVAHFNQCQRLAGVRFLRQVTIRKSIPICAVCRPFPPL